jgi:hypothetical protein
MITLIERATSFLKKKLLLVMVKAIPMMNY